LWIHDPVKKKKVKRRWVGTRGAAKGKKRRIGRRKERRLCAFQELKREEKVLGGTGRQKRKGFSCPGQKKEKSEKNGARGE